MEKRTPKQISLLTPIAPTLCAGLFWLNVGRNAGRWFLAALWTVCAAIWWVRWFKSRKYEQNSDIAGGNENE